MWGRRTWVDDDGSLTVGTLFDAAKMNNMEAGIGDRPESVHDASSTPVSGTGNLTWTHTPISEYVKGVLVGVTQNYLSKLAFGVTKVTYGGKEMVRVMLQEEASMASQAWYYLPTNKIPQGAQSVVVTVANTEAKRAAFCATVTADGPVRPIFLTAGSPTGGTIAGRDFTQTLEQGAYYGILSALKQPTISGSLTEAIFGENLGSTPTPMWAAFSKSVRSHPGKSEAEGQRPEVKWTLAEKGNYGVAIVMMGLVKDWGEVTALPARPGLGDTCEFVADATNDVIWELKYDNRSATYPWAKVGGRPIKNEDTGAEYRESSTSTASATGAPTITLPLAMEADFALSARYMMSAATTAPGTSQKKATLYFGSEEQGGISISATHAYEFEGTTVRDSYPLAAAKGVVAGLRYAAVNNSKSRFYRLALEVDPIRVG